VLGVVLDRPLTLGKGIHSDSDVVLTMAIRISRNMRDPCANMANCTTVF